MPVFDPAQNTRANTLDFKPPLPSPWMQLLFRAFLPLLSHKVLNGLNVHIDNASLEKLKAIQGERCLLVPNHPSEWDPCVMFDVAKRLQENFYFVAAREVFDYSYGIRGWFFQKLGVYSLVRGSNDRKSLKTSMDVLARNKGRLVIFAEGEISNQNETLLPLESGVIQLAFMALNDVYKENGKNLETLPPLYLCPVSIRYLYRQEGLQEAIETAICQLEAATGIRSAEQPRFERLQKLASVILNSVAGQFGYEVAPEISMAENVYRLTDFMLTKLEQIINLPPDESLSYLDRVRRIRNTVDHILNQPTETESDFYQKRLHAHQKAVLKNFYEDLDRVVNFVAIFDGYLHPNMDETRYIELIRRLEKEVFGSRKLTHPRTGRVKVHDPINLKEAFQQFQEDKRSVVNRITGEVEQLLYQGLEVTTMDHAGKKTITNIID